MSYAVMHKNWVRLGCYYCQCHNIIQALYICSYGDGQTATIIVALFDKNVNCKPL